LDGTPRRRQDEVVSGPEGGRRAILAAFSANLGIAIAKFVGFVFTRSSSMLAEAVHSLADTGNQLLLLLGAKRASRAPTAEHSFGFGRERYFWAFVVALVLFIGGATFAIYEGITKIRRPHELASPAWAIVILLLALALESYSIRTALVEVRHVNVEGVGLLRFVRESRAPELPVVVLEDTGALIGLVLALTGVTLTLVTDQPVFDGIATLCIGVLLAVIAVTLAVEMKSLLIGESALPAEERRIGDALSDAAEIRSLIHLRTQYLGPEDLLVAAKLEFDEHLTMPELARAIDDAEARVRTRVPSARLMFIEPDLRRAR
jgi:cation diffusion facilitator family transporter